MVTIRADDPVAREGHDQLAGWLRSHGATIAGTPGGSATPSA